MFVEMCVTDSQGLKLAGKQAAQVFLLLGRWTGRGSRVGLGIDRHIAQKALGHGMGELKIRSHSRNHIRERTITGQATNPASSRAPRKPRRNDAKSKWTRVQSDGFLQFLGRAEGNFLAGLDVDGFARGGVAAHARGALAHLQDAEADDADAFALLEVLGDAADQVVENGFRLLLRQLLLIGDGCREMLQRNGGRGRCFLRHIWPSSLLMAWETKTYQALNDSGVG